MNEPQEDSIDDIICAIEVAAMKCYKAAKRVSEKFRITDEEATHDLAMLMLDSVLEHQGETDAKDRLQNTMDALLHKMQEIGEKHD